MDKVLLEKAHRNTIRFNPFGSLVCIAGFGNLAGDMDFFGRLENEESNTPADYLRVATCEAHCTVSADWSPDGRHLMTAVLAPRMRVDNGVSVWRALSGTNIAHREYDELHEVHWKPELPGESKFLDVSVAEIEQ